MKSKRIYILLIAAIIGLVAWAQDDEARKKEINQVKLHPTQYLYAEVVAPDLQTAKSLAEEYLQTKIGEYVNEKKKLAKSGSVVALDTKSHWETISMPRGTNMFRIFVYVKKSDIVPAENATVIETMPTAITPHEETIGRLLKLRKFSELEACLKQLKQEGRIVDYDKIKNLSDPENYVLLIFNRAGDIEAILSEGEQRTNLRTRQKDSTANYKGRGAVGVKIK